MFKIVQYFLLFFLSIFLLTPSSALAAENWVINNFHSQITILADGKVEVLETIEVDFGTLPKHGIYRDIPYIYPTDGGKTIYTDIQIKGILQDGQGATYESSKMGNFLRLKIGKANRTITRRHTYQIKYLARGVLRSFEDYDELYWDITGNGWTVPITQASATLILPENGLMKITCFEGAFGSKTPCISNLLSPTQATFKSSRALKPTEGLTVVAGFKKGLVPIITHTPPPVSYSPTSANNIFFPNPWVVLLTLLLGGGLVFGLWWKKGKETNLVLETLVVEYFPPDHLKPAEVGTLLDERADTLDVSATIIDLAARGFLTIKEEPKKWLFGSTDYALSKTKKDTASLLPYEKELLNRIFTDGDQAKVSGLKREFYDDLAKVKENLYKDVVEKKFFPANPEKVRSIYTALGIIILILGGAGTFFGFLEPTGILGGLGLGTIGTGIILLILSRSFSKRTAEGHKLFRKILGFKLFVEKAEKYKQQFLERENIFNEVLPYAIVFGATEKFAKAFGDLGIKPPPPTWYSSSRPFNALLFSSTINSFSSSLNSAIAAQPTRNSFASSSSGFSGGGGSSGGGFGGGGGGSW